MSDRVGRVSEGRSGRVFQEAFKYGCRHLGDVSDQHTLVSILLFLCVWVYMCQFFLYLMCTQGTSVDALADALIVTGVKVHTVRIIPGIVVAFDF